MANEEEKSDTEAAAGGLSDAEWASLLKELNIDLSEATKAALVRPITDIEMDYLLRQYAFLEICDANAEESSLDNATVKIATAKSGWEIQGNNHRLIASPGRWLFGFYHDESESNGGMPMGTILKQILDTADNMIEIASKRWPEARIIEGYELMQFGAWIAAQRRGYTLQGFTPTEQQQKIFKHLIETKTIDLPQPTLDSQERPR